MPSKNSFKVKCFCSCHDLVSKKYMKDTKFICPKCNYNGTTLKHTNHLLI